MGKIATYRGKPIEQMSREELIDALNFLANDAKNEREEHMHQLEVLSSINNAQQSVQRTCFTCGGPANTSTGYLICENGCGGPVASR